MTTPQGWHVEDIKAALRKKFGALTHLSVRWGFHRTAISAAVTGKKRSSTIELRIARALKLPPHDLWPDRWSPDGRPLICGRDHTRDQPAPHRQIERAA